MITTSRSDYRRAMVGSEQTRLVVLRGNSGSGKSTVARRLRERLGRGVAWVEQDYLRRILLREHDRPGLPNIGLINNAVRYALDSGYHVILDGILFRPHYGLMLRELTGDHLGGTWHYYFDIPVEETLRRHATKPLASDVGPIQLVEWYNEGDLLGISGELIIGPDEPLDGIVDRVVREVDFPEPPVRDRLAVEAHL
jgi:predicted kinase